ncbi:glycoside hydrolase family 3 C-terminal domain-containing protein [Flavobacteriaceae bacterium]|nr:glycoside hydrolase family 3 C-terminal domain-containing protein [Flavobacteriaceae bacterium]
MKKLKSLVSVLVSFGLFGVVGSMYLKNSFLNLEKDYANETSILEIQVDGHTFLDLNANERLDVYEDERMPLEKRVSNLLSLMTLEEKIHLLKGSGIGSAIGLNEPGVGIPGAVGTLVATPRLGIPTVYLSDGPAGLRIEPKRKGEDRTYYSTAFPIATLLASTWNQELVYAVGNAMGTEAAEYGIDVILGPGMNIHRNPLCGRNFEYYSEDPVLSGYIGAAIVNGIESNGVGTSVKHFVANNQETDRDVNDAIVSERAMREIYLKGFEIVVREAQPWTIMSSYNKVNGTYTSQSEYLLTDVLRDDWGFEGLVMTDWFGGRDAATQISAGNDLLEPGTKKQWDALREASEDGRLSSEIIDRAAGRILTLIFKSGKLKRPTFSNNPDLKAHAEITRMSASEGMVLLKNENALPLENIKNIALLGITSYDFISGGTGSGDVKEAYTISLEEGLRNVGFAINQTAKSIYETHKAANKKAFLKPEGFLAVFDTTLPPEMTFTLEQLDTIVAESEVGVLTIGRNAGEGGDRVEVDDFLLSDVEKQMISDASKAFQSAGKKLIVVLNIGGVIETDSWKDQADAILLAWQGGQEGGNSAADLLSGNVNPSGKLPVTFPINLSDHASTQNFPQDGEQQTIFGLINNMMLGNKKARPEGKKIINKDYTNYEEGIYVGYRHFDKAYLEVSYPFGHGLSYTDFEYRNVAVALEKDSISVSLQIRNTGKRIGKEVVQVYVSKYNSTIDRSPQELKAFTKSSALEPNATEELQINIAVSDVRYWDEAKNDWALEKGSYTIKLGSSSRDISQVYTIEL